MVAWRSLYVVYYDWWTDRDEMDLQLARGAYMEALAACCTMAVLFEAVLMWLRASALVIP